MSESDNSELDFHEPAAFGQQLMLAREKAGMTIDEAARALNLKEETVEAIEDSALDKLPPVAFVQGYIRTYARLVGLSEEKILSEFEQEVPHELESELHPRSPLPNEANSSTPVIRLISILVIVLALLVLFFAIYSYYIKRSERIEQASLAGDDDAMMQLPPEAPLIEQQAEVTEDELLSVDTKPVSVEDEEITLEPAEETMASSAQQVEIQPEQDAAVETAEEPPEDPPSEAIFEEIVPMAKPQPITGGDVLSLRAEQESWAEIVDANDIRLFYGTLVSGRELSLTGQAPFEVFLGNAPVVSLSLNSTNIDMTKYIRSNNIAQFKISIEDGRARFH
jgi:cytoskeleton protein RodZ